MDSKYDSMIRERYYGEDTPFSAWLRQKGREGVLPSSSNELGINATDVDMVVQCYKINEACREVQCLFWIEVKTRGKFVGYAQNSIFNQMSMFARQVDTKDLIVRFYGVMQLILSHTSPSDSDQIQWRRYPWSPYGRKTYPRASDIKTNRISEDMLVDILCCRVHPSSLRPWPLFSKRHHGVSETSELIETELPNLGPVLKPVRNRY